MQCYPCPAMFVSLTQFWLWVSLWLWVWCVGTAAAACPKVCECKWKDGKETVSCVSSGFIDIPRGLDPSTQVLDLRRNNLRILPKDAFLDVDLLNLQKIWMTHCNLKRLEAGALRKLANLVELDLSNNILKDVPSVALGDVPGLRELHLSHNLLENITDAAFTPTPDLVRLDLTENQIKHIDSRAFRGLSRLEVLKLSSNKLKILRSEVLIPLVALHGLNLDNNPWQCDCSLRQLRSWMTERNVASSEPPICSMPLRISGSPWSVLTIDDFACPPKITAVAQRVLVALDESVSLTCRVQDDVNAKVTWLLRDRPIRNTSDSYRYLINEFISPNKIVRISNLTILRAALQDQGMYHCIAKNKAGRHDTNLTLMVSNKITEVRLVALDDVYVAGGLLTGVACLMIVLFLVIGIMFRRRRRHPDVIVDNKMEIPTSSRNQGVLPGDGLISKLSDYQIVPTSDLEDSTAVHSRGENSWMVRDASIDDFAPSKDLEKSPLYNKRGKGRSHERQDSLSRKSSPSTVSYVEIPKAGPLESSSPDKGLWKDLAEEAIRRRDLQRSPSQPQKKSTGSQYPDLLDLPLTQPLYQKKVEDDLQKSDTRNNEKPTFETFGHISSTLPNRSSRLRRMNSEGGNRRIETRTTPEGRAEPPWAKLEHDTYSLRSSSVVDLSSPGPPPFPSPSSPTNSFSNARNHQQRQSLTGTPPLTITDPLMLKDIFPSARTEYLPEGAAEPEEGPAIMDSADAFAFQYHAKQLDKFLLEYRNLQEQLYMMKESYELHKRQEDQAKKESSENNTNGNIDESSLTTQSYDLSLGLDAFNDLSQGLGNHNLLASRGLNSSFTDHAELLNNIKRNHENLTKEEPLKSILKKRAAKGPPPEVPPRPGVHKSPVATNTKSYNNQDC